MNGKLGSLQLEDEGLLIYSGMPEDTQVESFQMQLLLTCVSVFSGCLSGEGALPEVSGGAEPLQPSLHGGHGAGV